MAIFTEEVVVRLFRRISISAVYGSIKEESEDSTSQLDEDGESYVLKRGAIRSSVVVYENGSADLSRSSGKDDGPKSAERNLTSSSSAYDHDSEAEKYYDEVLDHVKKRGPLKRAEQALDGVDSTGTKEQKQDKREAICSELQHSLPVPPPPSKSINVTTLQNIFPRTRQFLHRLPLLLRLLLMLLSYSHTVDINSINVSCSGKRLNGIFQQHTDKLLGRENENEKTQELGNEISSWLTDADFCMQLTEISALGQVSPNLANDIAVYLRCADSMAYRTVRNRDHVEQQRIARLGGTDATGVIPAFLLPHHEHVLPKKPDDASGDGDHTHVNLSVHIRSVAWHMTHSRTL